MRPGRAGDLVAQRRVAGAVVSGAGAPPEIWLLDVSTRTLRQVTHTPYQGINPATLVRPELVTFKAHDGPRGHSFACDLSCVTYLEPGLCAAPHTNKPNKEHSDSD